MKYQRIVLTSVILVLSIGSDYAIAGKIYHCKDASGNNAFQDYPCKDTTVEVNSLTQSESPPNSSNTNQASTSKVLSCKAQNEKELRQIMSGINAYYNKRLKGCKMSFKRNSFQFKNCVKEQEEIKQNKIKKDYEPRIKNCT